MKTNRSKCGIIFALSFLSLSGVAKADTNWPQEVVSNAAVQAIYQLLNTNHQGTCAAPTTTDLHSYCLGGLPMVSAPTIAGVGCSFSLTISCSDGAKAKISGTHQAYEIVDQNRTVSDYTPAGVFITKVDLQ